MSIKVRRGLLLVALMVVVGALLLIGGASSPTEAQSLETQQPSASSAGAPGCPTDYTTATDLFFDDLENPASGNWTTSGTGWYYPPGVDKINATSGTTNFWGNDGSFESDHAISMVTGVTLPTGKLTYLSFNHDYGFEAGDNSTGPYRDGGVLEYSTNNGSTWIDAGPLITDNGYRGVIFGFNSSNPLSGRQGFVGDSNGYISTRVNLSDLSSLEEQSIRFRFRIGTDESVGDDAWFVDDIRVYTCEGDTTPPTVSSTSPANNATDIVLGKGLSATFSEEMDASTTDGDPSTLTTSTFTLTKQGSSTPLEAQVSYDSATKKAILDPTSDLEANTTYTATIKGGSTGAEDLAGNALAEDYTWSFTTGAPPAPNCTKTGTANAETISGTSGADVICAGGGNDTIKGLGGNDILKGQGGNDKLLGGVGDDTLDGGTGTDTASYSASLTAVTASLATNTSTGEGKDTFVGVENLLGSSKADTLTGSIANNTLKGGAGGDKVVGSGGADFLYGEDGADTVNSKDGVNGNDSLYGGAGTDTKVTDATEKSIVGFP